MRTVCVTVVFGCLTAVLGFTNFPVIALRVTFVVLFFAMAATSFRRRLDSGSWSQPEGSIPQVVAEEGARPL